LSSKQYQRAPAAALRAPWLLALPLALLPGRSRMYE
jgi:hypothetical protein